MRVIAGEAKSMRLAVPKGATIRPTSDVVREALFSSLGDAVIGVRFLDLYAGTGAVGIEALSRGAAFCVFVERARRSVQAIRANLENTRVSDRAAVVQRDAKRAIERVLVEHGPFAIVFIDPPYDDGSAARVAEKVLSAQAFEEPGLLIFQHSRNAPPEGLPEPERVRTYGETVLSFYELPLKGD